MELKALLQFDRIVIQCHDNPDADAIASGYGVFTYLRAHGKQPRLIYGGVHAVQKSNLKRMVERLHIPIEHVRELEEEPELLLTVDCQPGEGNVQRFPGRKTAAIDHHITRKDSLSGLWAGEIRDNYGACATIVWDMLRKEGFPVTENRSLTTALYYGLFMDTCKLQEICQLMDRTMRDMLEMKCDDAALDEFRTHNLTTEELQIVGRALAGCSCDEKYRFAIAQADCCDPNLLGIISDQMLETDTVDTCIAYCMQAGGAKLSVRSCSNETRANDLAGYLAGGGGHERKAGGFLAVGLLKYDTIDPSELGSIVRRFLDARMKDYFQGQDLIHAGGESGTYPDLSKEPLYQKKPLEIGYVRAADVYDVGTRIKIRMLEGDRVETVSEDLYFIIGVKHEVYINTYQKLAENNELLEKPYVLSPQEAQDVEDAVNAVQEEDRQLSGHIRTCIPRHSCIRGYRLERRTKVFHPDGRSYYLGEPGDYLVSRVEDPSDLYIIRRDVFEWTYERITEDTDG